MQAQTRAELAYLALIDACADVARTSTYLANRSNQVWSLHTGSGPRTVTYGDAKDAVARTATLETAAIALLVPDSSVTVSATPLDVEWQIDPVRTGVYQLTVQAEEKAAEVVVDKSPSLFKKGSWTHAFVGCAKVGYQLGSAAQAARSAQDVDAQAEAVSDGIGSAWEVPECYRGFADADIERAGSRAGAVENELRAVPRSRWQQFIEGPVVRGLELGASRFHGRI